MEHFRTFGTWQNWGPDVVSVADLANQSTITELKPGSVAVKPLISVLLQLVRLQSQSCVEEERSGSNRLLEGHGLSAPALPQ